MTEQSGIERAVSDPRPLAVIEAFLDGERVDTHALKAALADPAARDHLVDVLLLRGAVRELDPLAVPADTAANARRRVRERPSRAKWLAAAAMMLVSLTVGYAAGQRVVAPAAPSTVEAILQVEDPASAPAPTRSIAFTPGVNWTESPEGR
jgi:hypothetical protein